MTGKDYEIAAIPLIDFSGAKIGLIEIASDVTSIVEASQQTLWTTAIVTIVVSPLSLLGFLLFARSLAGVIRNVTDTMTASLRATSQ